MTPTLSFATPSAGFTASAPVSGEFLETRAMECRDFLGETISKPWSKNCSHVLIFAKMIDARHIGVATHSIRAFVVAPAGGLDSRRER